MEDRAWMGTCHRLLVICWARHAVSWWFRDIRPQGEGACSSSRRGGHRERGQLTPSTMPRGNNTPKASILTNMCAHNVESYRDEAGQVSRLRGRRGQQQTRRRFDARLGLER